MASPYHVVGQRVPRAESWTRATGAAQFAADLKLPGMLMGKILRSPLPHAKILHVDVSAAERLPGVKAVVTAADAPALRFGRMLKQETVLARGKVRYVGEPVAAVAAVDDLIAEEALDLIQVEYEELPAAFDPLEALKPDAPLIHEELATYPDSSGAEKGGNVRARKVIVQGDVEQGFAMAEVIHEARYTVPAVHASAIEPRASLATVDPNGKLTLWASFKAPFGLRATLCEALRLPRAHVRVIAPAVGGDFGGKGAVTIEAICCLLALRARRPVKLVMTRQEELAAAYKRHAAVIDLKLGARRDGTLTAVQGRIVYNGGAYTIGSGAMADRCSMLQGCYRVPNVLLEGFNVYTNNCPSGNMRAPAAPQANFAIESAMAALARKLAMDPLELRRKNAVGDGDTTPDGRTVLYNVGLAQTFEAVGVASGTEEPAADSTRGFACGHWATRPMDALPQAGAWVKLNDDGTVALVTGVTEQGAGQHCILAQIVAEALGLNPTDVAVVASDTDGTPFDQGTGGSNTTYRAGNATRLAAMDLRQQLLALAAQALEANPDDLDMEDKRVFVRGSHERAVSFQKLYGLALRGTVGQVVATGLRQRQELSAALGELKGRGDAPAFGTHMVDLHVDEETGQVELRSYVASQDVGFAINPLQVEGQIQGAVSFGIGFALTEQVMRNRGRTLNPNLADYKLPTAVDVPLIRPLLVEKPSTYGPFGAKGVGEPGTVPSAPAIANAIQHATGVEITDLPITPEKIRWAMVRRESEARGKAKANGR